MKNIDLQCHTTASDGKLSPKELVEIASKSGLCAVAITDHDTIDGIAEAVSAAKGKDIEIIPGVEISCDDFGFIDTHVLGLFVDCKNTELSNLLNKAKEYRELQKKEIIAKFQKLGFKITYDEVRRAAKGEIGRPHIAKAVLKNNPDKVSSVDEVFDIYLGVGKKAFAERKVKIAVKEAIAAIHSAKGLAFAAHPGVYTNFNDEKFIEFFLKNGGDGIETYYSYETSRNSEDAGKSQELVKKYISIATKKKVLQTGGSDFHGKEGQILGKLKVPYSILSDLKKALKK